MKSWISASVTRALLPILLSSLGAGFLACATGHGQGAAAPVGSGRGQAGRGSAPGPGCPCARKVGQNLAPVPPPGPQPVLGVPPVADTAGAGATLLPVTDKDPTWGNPNAPVTVVEFSDFQCPFCARVGETVDELRHLYGPDQLRLVWKNLPLPFHDNARPAADAAMTVFALGGSDAFWKFCDLALANQRDFSPEHFLLWAVMAGVDGNKFNAELAARPHVAKVDQDLALAIRLGIRGTPVFRINGIPLMGAQPLEAFKEIIDAQLATAKALLAAGTPASRIYPVLSARNAATAPAAAEEAPVPEPEDTRIWRVPVEKSDPTRGSADALVTLVVFSDFQCPFCKQVEQTLAELERRYGKALRIVWKDYPLPFHDRAIPAAVLARVAFAKKGPRGFWQAHDALFAGQDDLDDAALKGIAKGLGLSWPEIRRAIAAHRYGEAFEASEDLAKTLRVSGTPCAFVNGYRVAGAVPIETFVAVIDAQLAKARALAGAPNKDNPTSASTKAKVTGPEP